VSSEIKRVRRRRKRESERGFLGLEFMKKTGTRVKKGGKKKESEEKTGEEEKGNRGRPTGPIETMRHAARYHSGSVS
jgi:hypothetical protein